SQRIHSFPTRRSSDLAFRHQRHAAGDAPLNLPAADLAPQVFDGACAAARQRQRAHDGIEQGRLARAVGTDHGDDAAAHDLDVGPADGRHLAIADCQVGDLEDGMFGFVRTAHWEPPAAIAPAGTPCASFADGVSERSPSGVTSRSSSIPPRYASSTAGLVWISSGVPYAILVPKSMTTMWSVRFMTKS